MEILQNILVYVTLALAVGFIVKTFILPKRVKANKKDHLKSCGQGRNCGCS